MFIQTEETPNPTTLKFLPGRVLMEAGTKEFRSAEEAAQSPLALKIFEQEGVTKVFFGTDFITVSKTDSWEWAVLKPLILGVIMEHFISKKPLFCEEPLPISSTEEDDPVVAEIKEILDTRVRPAVAMDGGDVVFDRFDDGVLYVQMQGACSGCPTSSLTLKSGIENMLRHYVPEVREVRSVDF